MFLSIGMLKLNYFLADIFILSAEKQPIKLSWRKIECLLIGSGSASASEALLGGLMPYTKRSTHRHTDTRQVLHRVDAQRRRDVREMPTRTEELGNLCNGQHLPECRWKNSLYA